MKQKLILTPKCPTQGIKTVSILCIFSKQFQIYRNISVHVPIYEQTCKHINQCVQMHVHMCLYVYIHIHIIYTYDYCICLCTIYVYCSAYINMHKSFGLSPNFIWVFLSDFIENLEQTFGSTQYISDLVISFNHVESVCLF